MVKENILYIAEDYLTSKVHHNLCSALGEKGLPVVVFAVKRKSNQNRRLQDAMDAQDYQVEIGEMNTPEVFYKYLFHHKIETKYRLLTEKIALETIAISCAATLFSEGALAYKLYREKNIPYIVAVRNTDVSFYLKMMPHLWKLGKEILMHARKIIFITPNLRHLTLQNKLFSSIKDEIAAKSEVIMNGVDRFWLDNIRQPLSTTTPFSLLYVGNFSRVKNLPRLFSACSKVKKKYPELTLTVVGGGGNQEGEVLKLAKKNEEWIFLRAKTNDRIVLRDYYRQASIFVMPSDETFGLVYVEALTQGLPILYGKERGFDGIYPENFIGCHAEINDENKMVEKIEYLISNRDELIQNIAMLDFEVFDWKRVAEKWSKVISN